VIGIQKAHMDKPDYSKYTIEALREAEQSIDSERYPENYHSIQNELESRRNNSVFPEKSENIEQADMIARLDISFWGRIYFGSLFFIIFSLFITNLINLVQGSLLSLFPLIIQGGLLYCLKTTNKNVKIWLRLWAVLLLIGGSFLLLSMFITAASFRFNNSTDVSQINFISIFYSVLSIAIGIYYLWGVKHYIRIVKKNKPNHLLQADKATSDADEKDSLPNDFSI